MAKKLKEEEKEKKKLEDIKEDAPPLEDIEWAVPHLDELVQEEDFADEEEPEFKEIRYEPIKSDYQYRQPEVDDDDHEEYVPRTLSKEMSDQILSKVIESYKRG